MTTLDQLIAEAEESEKKISKLGAQLEATNKELADLKAKSAGGAGDKVASEAKDEAKDETKDEPKLTATELCLKARAGMVPVRNPLSLTDEQINQFTGEALQILQARAAEERSKAENHKPSNN